MNKNQDFRVSLPEKKESECENGNSLSKNHPLPPFGKEQILDLLNLLLEAERAGAQILSKLSKEADTPEGSEMLMEIAVDEGEFCKMLIMHIARFEGTPSNKTGSFYEKVMALNSFTEKLYLLDRGQLWVVHQIENALPRIEDSLLRKDLLNMQSVHEDNIQNAASLIPKH